MVGAVSNCADAVRLETAPTGPGAMRFGLECLINSEIYYKLTYQNPFGADVGGASCPDAFDVGLGSPTHIHKKGFWHIVFKTEPPQRTRAKYEQSYHRFGIRGQIRIQNPKCPIYPRRGS